MYFTDEQKKELEALTKPLMQWLNDNCHPHVKAIVDNRYSVILEGITTTQLLPPDD